MSTWSIRPHPGPPVPERLSVAEQRAVQAETGVVPQRPGVPGMVVDDASGDTVLALSDASEVRFVRGGAPTSTAEVLLPAPTGESWPPCGRVRHDGLGWTDWQHESLDGALLGTGDAGPGRGHEWGLWAGSIVTAGAERYRLEDLVRPGADEVRARRARRRVVRPERMAGRALGHRFLSADGTEVGRLTWVGESQPHHHERPYEWHLDWSPGRPDDAVLVGAMACALRFMAYAGTMLSTS